MSSETGVDTPEDPRDPSQIAREATNDALSAVDEASDKDVAERARIEQEAANDFADAMALAVQKGLAKAHVRSACGQFADAAEYYTKSDVSDLIEDAHSAREAESGGRRSFDAVLEEDLDEVVIVRTTDAKQATLYRWQFGATSLETTATQEGRAHFHWAGFRNEYFDATGHDPAKPIPERKGGEEWREFIVAIVEDRGREVTTRGPRSSALDGLQNFIRRSIAYGDIEDMVERDGLYLDAAPEDDPEELWVPNPDIKRICDEYELATVRELQLELDARGYTVERINGVSESTFVNNNKVTYWALSADVAGPLDYVEDPQDPADQVRMEEQEESTNEPEAEHAEGEIGAVGADPDADEEDDTT